MTRQFLSLISVAFGIFCLVKSLKMIKLHFAHRCALLKLFEWHIEHKDAKLQDPHAQVLLKRLLIISAQEAKSVKFLLKFFKRFVHNRRLLLAEIVDREEFIAEHKDLLSIFLID